MRVLAEPRSHSILRLRHALRVLGMGNTRSRYPTHEQAGCVGGLAFPLQGASPLAPVVCSAFACATRAVVCTAQVRGLLSAAAGTLRHYRMSADWQPSKRLAVAVAVAVAECRTPQAS